MFPVWGWLQSYDAAQSGAGGGRLVLAEVRRLVAGGGESGSVMAPPLARYAGRPGFFPGGVDAFQARSDIVRRAAQGAELLFAAGAVAVELGVLGVGGRLPGRQLRCPVGADGAVGGGEQGAPLVGGHPYRRAGYVRAQVAR